MKRFVNVKVLVAALSCGLLLGVTACRVSDPPPSTPVPSGAIKEALFERLTSARWCNRNYLNSSRGLPDTSKSYVFGADGLYEWSHISDYPEAGGAGHWTLAATAEDEGLIYLDTGDVWRFVFPGDGSMVLISTRLDPCEPLSVTGEATALPTIKPSDLFEAITAHEWFRMSDLNPDTEPSSITYLVNGQWTADFRGGACTEMGSWSLSDSQIVRTISGTPCDFRLESGKDYNLRYDVSVSGGVLESETVLYSSSPLVAGEDGVIPILAFGRETYELTMHYSRPLRVGKPARLIFQLTNHREDPLILQAARVEATPFRRIGKSTESTGQAMILAEAALGSVELGPGVMHEFSLAFTPQSPGDIYLGIVVEVQGTRQRYDANRVYAAEVEGP